MECLPTHEVLSPDLIAVTLVTPRTILKHSATRVLKALCDCGGPVAPNTLLNKKLCLKELCQL